MTKDTSRYCPLIKVLCLIGMANVNEATVDYSNKIILAPMVRMNTLPFRLLSLDHGADLVYSEELVDHKLVKTERRVNDVLGTVDFVDPLDGQVVFRTCPREKNKIILQIGTASAERALEAAKKVEKDVAAIDINMGCPKQFSLAGGMGAALLSTPDIACNILTTLVNNLSIPVTCKVRVFSNETDTIVLCKKLEACGIAAIGVHGRTKAERPRHANRVDMIRTLTQHLKIPVIANGGSKDIMDYPSILKFKSVTNASSVMVARAAQDNCSIFSSTNGVKDIHQLIKEYLKYCVDYDNAAPNSKYCVQSMLGSQQESPLGKKFLESQSLEQMCDLWGLGDYWRQKKDEYTTGGLISRWELTPPPPSKKARTQFFAMDASDVFSLNCAFLRNFYPVQKLPKTLLYAHCKFQRYDQPKYETKQNEKLFRSLLTVNGKQYTSKFWEKNKRNAEQGAAIVCLSALGFPEYSEKELREAGVLR
ncbi:hypothetical protein WDU94_008230 [Cyamophila willieti]